MDTPLLDVARSFAGKRVLCLGDVMLDEYILGNVRRISPEAPVPVIEIQSQRFVPGGVGNVAANVASLGGRPVLISIVGADHQAARLRDALTAKGVPSDTLVADAQRQTTTKTRIIAHQQQIARVDAEQREPLSAAAEDELVRRAEQAIAEVDACILSDYAKGVISPTVATRVIASARRLGRPVIVDPKGTNYAKYRGATVVKPNLSEAERAVNADITCESSLERAGRMLLEPLEGGSVLLTRGSQGMTLFQPGRDPVHIVSVAQEVFDVTGAGDTVVSTLALALAAGASLGPAALLANRAASVAVARIGTTAVTMDELMQTLRQVG